MGIDFKSALLYPWEREHWIQTVAYPAAGTLVFLLVSGLSLLLMPILPPFSLLSGVIGNLIFNALVAGYAWHCCTRWQTMGMHAPPPDWKAGLADIFLDGLKVLLYCFLLMGLPVILLGGMLLGSLIPALLGATQSVMGGEVPVIENAFAWNLLSQMALFIGVISFGSVVFAPFLAAPVIYAAGERSFRALFDLPAAWGMVGPRYLLGLKAMGWIVLLNLAYMVAQGVLSMMGPTAILVFFMMMPFLISMMHIWNQGLWDQPLPATPPATDSGKAVAPKP